MNINIISAEQRKKEEELWRLREDPLFEIKKAEYEHQKALLENPLVKARLAGDVNALNDARGGTRESRRETNTHSYEDRTHRSGVRPSRDESSRYGPYRAERRYSRSRSPHHRDDKPRHRRERSRSRSRGEYRGRTAEAQIKTSNYETRSVKREYEDRDYSNERYRDYRRGEGRTYRDRDHGDRYRDDRREDRYRDDRREDRYRDDRREDRYRDDRREDRYRDDRREDRYRDACKSEVIDNRRHDERNSPSIDRNDSTNIKSKHPQDDRAAAFINSRGALRSNGPGGPRDPLPRQTANIARLTDEERKVKLEQMLQAGAAHVVSKTREVVDIEAREKELAALEAEQRMRSKGAIDLVYKLHKDAQAKLEKEGGYSFSKNVSTVNVNELQADSD